MQSYDSKILTERLEELTEVFGAKAISQKGLSVWFSVLREFPTERVCSVLIAWPRSHSKMPSPAEVWKVVNDMGIGERERKAQEEKNRVTGGVFQPGVGGEKAEQFIAQIRTMLKQPKWTPAEHWQRNLKRFPAGHIGHEYAKAFFLSKSQMKKEREPGEDDDLERAA